MRSTCNFWLFSLILAFQQGLPCLAGKEARPGEFPYMIFMKSNLIDFNKVDLEKIPCMGVLIAPQWVLADAACASSFDEKNDKVSPVHSGISPSVRKEAYVVRVNAVALLELDRSVPLKDGFSPLKLAKGSFSGKATLTVPTWSRGSDGKYSTALKYEDVEVIDLNTCRRQRPSEYLAKRDKMICGPVVSANAPFNLRGPLVRRGGKPTEDVLVGMFNVATDQGVAGGMTYPIYTSIGEFAAWIKSKSGV